MLEELMEAICDETAEAEVFTDEGTEAPFELDVESESPIAENDEPSQPDEKAEESDFSAEREELKMLRTEVARLRAEAQRLAEGYAELMDLYPSAQLNTMPDSFNEAVKQGVPPAAAYALEMRRREVRAKRAEAARKTAEKSSVGRISTVDDGLFTPDEVRGMSRREVRENYGRIMESMRHWK